jgi:hypothetical protein
MTTGVRLDTQGIHRSLKNLEAADYFKFKNLQKTVYPAHSIKVKSFLRPMYGRVQYVLTAPNSRCQR